MLISIFWYHCLIVAYRPGYECATKDTVNQSLSNDSNFIVDEKCQIKMFKNDTNGIVLKSVRECTSGYKYSLDKQSTIVTEVIKDRLINEHSKLYLNI